MHRPIPPERGRNYVALLEDPVVGYRRVQFARTNFPARTFDERDLPDIPLDDKARAHPIRIRARTCGALFKSQRDVSTVNLP